MISEEQLIFFTGIPGSAWARVSTLLGYSPVLNLNLSDHSKEREYYIKRNTYTSWKDLVNHQGSFFGSRMEFGKGWEYPVERGVTKEAIMEDIHKAFDVHNDQNYLIKSHSIAQSLDWWIEQFPNSKFIFVFRDFEKSMAWWFQGGGFDITYPHYDWYEDEERMRHKAKLQQWNSLEFIHRNNVTTYGLTTGLLKKVLEIEFDNDPDINKHYRAINALPKGKDKGTPNYDIQIGFYGFEEIL